jgi:hypothetical protein
MNSALLQRLDTLMLPSHGVRRRGDRFRPVPGIRGALGLSC